MSITLTILGCGSSGGVPRVGLGWGACDPDEPRNRRRRCSVLVERVEDTRRTSVLIDTSPDLREQLIEVNVRHLDAVLFTHDHADHTHGIDDLRGLVLNMRRRIPVYAEDATRATLFERFGYCFETPPGSEYPPILDMHRLNPEEPIEIDGAAGPIRFRPFRMEHGSTMALGFRIGDIAYAPDISRLPDDDVSKLADLDVLILDALRYKPHPTHFSVSEALDLIALLKPRRGILTNLHSDLDFRTLSGELPPNVEVAFDGLQVLAD